MLTACYINNRVYHSGVNGIPVTLANGHIPDLSHLRIFGCPTYVHILADQRRKMTDTAFRGILVGYPTDTYGYLIYNPKTRRVVTTRHVRFDETFGGRLSEEGISLQQPLSLKSTQSPTARVPILSSSDDEDDDRDPMPTHPVPNSGGERSALPTRTAAAAQPATAAAAAQPTSDTGDLQHSTSPQPPTTDRAATTQSSPPSSAA